MKKKNIILMTLFFIIILFGFNDKVYAAKECKSVDCKDEIAEEKAKYENSTNSKLVCSYAVYDNKKEKQYANYIYYDVNKEIFYANSTIKENFSGTLTFGEPTFGEHQYRYVLGDAGGVLQNFNRCPRYSYIDFDWYNEICFDSDGTSCTNFEGTSNGYGDKENSKLVDDLVSQYKDYDNSFKGSCDEDNVLKKEYGNLCRFTDDSANYILVYYNNSSSVVVVYDSKNNNKFSVRNGYEYTYTKNKNEYKYINNINGLTSCPNNLYIEEQMYVTGIVGNSQGYTSISIYASSTGLTDYTTNFKLTPCTEDKDVDVDNTDDVDCTIISDTIRGYINDVMTYIRIGVPILLLCLIIYDFASAIFASSDDKMKKAQGRVIKRIIIAIVIFFVPTLINLVFDIVNDVWAKNYQICGIEEYEK